MQEVQVAMHMGMLKLGVVSLKNGKICVKTTTYFEVLPDPITNIPLKITYLKIKVAMAAANTQKMPIAAQSRIRTLQMLSQKARFSLGCLSKTPLEHVP